MKNNINDFYWNGNKLLSHTDCDILQVIGGRGRGKTYFFKNLFIDDWIENKHESVFLMRYDTDFKNIDLYFNDMDKEKYKDYSFKVEKNRGYIKKKKEKKWNLFCYFVAMSKAKTFKGTNYPLVYNILFDEFQIDTTDKRLNKYINGELKYFSDIIESFSRLRKVRIIMASNAISVNNPYFTAWHIMPEYDKIVKTKNVRYINLSNGEKRKIIFKIATEMTPSKDEFLEMKVNTISGKIALFSGMGESSLNNEYMNDNDNFIASKPEKARFCCNLMYGKKMYGVWYYFDPITADSLYISRHNNPTSKRTYCFRKSDITENAIFCKTYKNIVDLERLRRYVKKNKCFYSTQHIKYDCFEIFTTINLY